MRVRADQLAQLVEEFGPAGRAEFLAHPGHVVFDRLGRDEESVTDLFVGQAGHYQRGDLAFPVAEDARVQFGAEGSIRWCGWHRGRR